MIRLLRAILRLFGVKGRRRSRRFARKAAKVDFSGYRPFQEEGVIEGQCWVIDGDTIVIGGTHIRLAGIDAPELDHPYGKQSKWALVRLCRGQVITARLRPELSYDRVVADCYLPDGRDLSAELVRCGLALDWPKFSGGKYKHLETDEARRKLWRADARQKGRIRPSNSSR